MSFRLKYGNVEVHWLMVIQFKIFKMLNRVIRNILKKHHVLVLAIFIGNSIHLVRLELVIICRKIISALQKSGWMNTKNISIRKNHITKI